MDQREKEMWEGEIETRPKGILPLDMSHGGILESAGRLSDDHIVI